MKNLENIQLGSILIVLNTVKIFWLDKILFLDSNLNLIKGIKFCIYHGSRLEIITNKMKSI